MRRFEKDSKTIVFRTHIGKGNYKGVNFEFDIATNPDGELVGFPIISWENGARIVFELSDLVPMAYKAAHAEEA